MLCHCVFYASKKVVLCFSPFKAVVFKTDPKLIMTHSPPPAKKKKKPRKQFSKINIYPLKLCLTLFIKNVFYFLFLLTNLPGKGGLYIVLLVWVDGFLRHISKMREQNKVEQRPDMCVKFGFCWQNYFKHKFKK